MSLNGNTKKVAGWSAATIISVSLGAIALWQKGGA
ncbi:hypothetical protein LCGC14_2763340, partial [marine sediment metagenome]